jgi:hypothetical protein
MSEPFKLILKNLDEPGYTPDIGCYQQQGGYEALRWQEAQPPGSLA